MSIMLCEVKYVKHVCVGYIIMCNINKNYDPHVTMAYRMSIKSEFLKNVYV